MFEVGEDRLMETVKTEHLTQFTNPSPHPADAEPLFLLTRANNFDLSFYLKKILQDYLLELGRLLPLSGKISEITCGKV